MCFMCLFFRWSVRRTLASMELSGGREVLGTKGRLRYLPLCKGDLFYLLSPVTLGHIDERFAKRSMRAGTRVLDYIFFCDPLFSCKGGVSLRWGVEIDRASRRCLGRSLPYLEISCFITTTRGVCLRIHWRSCLLPSRLPAPQGFPVHIETCFTR